MASVTQSMSRVLATLVLLSVAGIARPVLAVEVERVVSPGGIEAWLVREPAIPIVALEASWQGGARLDPAGKVGLANMVSGLVDEGAGELDSQAFQGRLEDLAIRLSFDASKDSFSASLKTLSAETDPAFDLLRLALTKPRFDTEPVGRIRRQIELSIRQRQRDPDAIAARTWFRLAFPDHAYGRPTRGTLESVAAITPADLTDFVGRVIGRNNLTIGVVGDITADRLRALLDRTFGDLPEVALPPQAADVWPTRGPTLRVIDYESPQSAVMFGFRGLKRDDPDYYAAYVMNRILGGGGFTSRLTEEVREKRGLTYGIYSYLHPLDQSGLYLGGLSTSNPNVAEALDLTRKEIRRMRDSGVTETELADAKTYINGSFPLRLTSSGRIAAILVAMRENHLGIDYLDRRADLISAVTAADIRRVAARLLKPEDLIVVVVGRPRNLSGG